jgi:hypothetical protein
MEFFSQFDWVLLLLLLLVVWLIDFAVVFSFMCSRLGEHQSFVLMNLILWAKIMDCVGRKIAEATKKLMDNFL